MKIGNLFNLESFQRFVDSPLAAGFQDSAAGVVLARNLTAVDPKIFRKKYPELTFVNSGITVSNTGGYAKRIQSLRVIDQGDFADAGDDAANKGKISLSAEDNFLKVFVKEAHSKWTDDEIKEADMQNSNLVSEYVSAHTRKYNQKIDSIGLIGQGSQTGLLNAGFTATAATNPIAIATPQELYDDIGGLITDQWNAVYNVPEYKADVVMMPTDVYNHISRVILNTAAGSSTVLKALMDNFPGVKFMASPKADNVGGSSKTCAFSTNEESMVMRIPLALTIGEIVKISSFNFQIDSKFRIGGLDVLESTSGRYVTGL